MADEEGRALDVIKGLCEASKQRRAEDMVPFYTEDAVMLPPGKAIIKGHDAVRSIFQEVFDIGATELQNHNFEVEVDGSTAIVYANYTLPGKDGKTIGKGNTFCVLRKDEKSGEWKITHDIWN